MSNARGSGVRNNVVERPIENSYVLPGTLLVAGEYPGAPPTRPAAALDQRLGIFLDAGITVFIDLTAAKDKLAPYEPALRALAKQRDRIRREHQLPIEEALRISRELAGAPD